MARMLRLDRRSCILKEDEKAPAHSGSRFVHRNHGQMHHTLFVVVFKSDVLLFDWSNFFPGRSDGSAQGNGQLFTDHIQYVEIRASGRKWRAFDKMRQGLCLCNFLTLTIIGSKLWMVSRLNTNATAGSEGRSPNSAGGCSVRLSCRWEAGCGASWLQPSVLPGDA